MPPGVSEPPPTKLETDSYFHTNCNTAASWGDGASLIDLRDRRRKIRRWIFGVYSLSLSDHNFGANFHCNGQMSVDVFFIWKDWARLADLNG